MNLVRPFLVLLALTTAIGEPVSAQQRAQRIGPAGRGGQTTATDDCQGDIVGFSVRAGWWIDGIMLHCRTINGAVGSHPHRGGTGGGQHNFVLQPGEQLRAVSGSFGSGSNPYIYGIRFHTDRRISPTYGEANGAGETTFRLDIPEGQALQGIETMTSANALHGLVLLTRPSGKGSDIASRPATMADRSRPASAIPSGFIVMPVPSHADPEACPKPSGRCTDFPGRTVWEGRSGGAPLPRYALDMGAGRARICRAYLGVPGERPEPLLGTTETDKPGCTVAIQTRLFTATDYEVLIGLPTADGTWGEFTERDLSRFILVESPGVSLPPASVTAATFRGEQQAICTATIGEGETVLGRASAATRGCLVVMNGYAVTHPAYYVIGQLDSRR